MGLYLSLKCITLDTRSCSNYALCSPFSLHCVGWKEAGTRTWKWAAQTRLLFIWREVCRSVLIRRRWTLQRYSAKSIIVSAETTVSSPASRTWVRLQDSDQVNLWSELSYRSGDRIAKQALLCQLPKLCVKISILRHRIDACGCVLLVRG